MPFVCIIYVSDAMFSVVLDCDNYLLVISPGCINFISYVYEHGKTVLEISGGIGSL